MGFVMSAQSGGESEDYLSPADMRKWMDDEIRQSTKALELRTRDLTSFVTAYCAGELTPQQADELHSRYYRRWGEPIPGVSLVGNIPDEEVLAQIDKLSGPSTGPKELSRRYRQRYGLRQDDIER